MASPVPQSSRLTLLLTPRNNAPRPRLRLPVGPGRRLMTARRPARPTLSTKDRPDATRGDWSGRVHRLSPLRAAPRRGARGRRGGLLRAVLPAADQGGQPRRVEVPAALPLRGTGPAHRRARRRGARRRGRLPPRRDGRADPELGG